MNDEKTQIENAIRQLQEFLAANRMRQTRERIVILQTAYKINGPFTIDQLSDALKAQNFHVSTATLYAATDILTRANLLLRHPAPVSSMLFERIPEAGIRCYQVCNSCRKVKYIERKDVLAAIQQIPVSRFTVSHRMTYIYGICTQCKTKQKRQLKQLKSK